LNVVATDPVRLTQQRARQKARGLATVGQQKPSEAKVAVDECGPQ
jgi:hypothetical protein